MQAVGLSLMKGRLGSDQERREIQTRPNENAPEAWSWARPEGARRRTPPPRRSKSCVPGPDLDPSEPTRIRSRLMPTTTQPSRSGMREALRRAADAPRRREPRTDILSAPRSRQAMVVGGRSLVKAGLRPPPPAATALTTLRPPTSRAAREIEGRERPRASRHTPAARERKKSAAPLLTKAPIRARS
jgi:hypothetical protein